TQPFGLCAIQPKKPPSPSLTNGRSASSSWSGAAEAQIVVSSSHEISTAVRSFVATQRQAAVWRPQYALAGSSSLFVSSRLSTSVRCTVESKLSGNRSVIAVTLSMETGGSRGCTVHSDESGMRTVRSAWLTRQGGGGKVILGA